MATEEESNRKKFSNWLQSVQSLEETKKALHEEVIERWKKELMTWGKDERDGIPIFIKCVDAEKITYSPKQKAPEDKWRCCCHHQQCTGILKHLLKIQQNPGSSVVWNSALCGKLADESIETKSEEKNERDESENIPRVEERSPWMSFIATFFGILMHFNETRENRDVSIPFKDIFPGCKEVHVWCIANMFMQRGKMKTSICNTGPDDTDAAMFFRMMKNCKLFDIEDGIYLYDEVLLCRDRLHHSPNNRIKRAEAESHLNTMKTLLEKFDIPKCRDAMTSIDKTLRETILAISLPDINLNQMIQNVLKLKKSALEVDKETNKDKGFENETTAKLLQETVQQLDNTESQGKLTDINVASDSTKSSKDPKKHFEATTRLLKVSLDNPEIAALIERKVNPLLDAIVNEVAESDSTFRQKADSFAEQENLIESDHEQENLIESDHEQANLTEGAHGQEILIESDHKQENPSAPHTSTTNICQPVPPMLHQRVWSVAFRKNYNVKVAGDIGSCYITGCCQLPTGGFLLVDTANERLKKLDSGYQVISACKLPRYALDVCSIGYNEAVLSHHLGLKFVDVKSMTLTKSVSTQSTCVGLTCHGRQLYVTSGKTVDMYNNRGVQQRVLYNNTEAGWTFIYGLAVSNDGSKLYIAAKNKLVTIDSLGNHMYTLTAPEILLAIDVCVDNNDNVLLVDRDTCRILQIRSDGKHIDGTVCENIDRNSPAICFDKQKHTLMIAGKSDAISILQLKCVI